MKHKFKQFSRFALKRIKADHKWKMIFEVEAAENTFQKHFAFIAEFFFCFELKAAA